jgi:hypothetical protein
MDQKGRPDTDTSVRVSVSASTAQRAATPPDGLQPWQRKDMEARRDRLAEEYAAILDMPKAEVIDLWRADQKQLRKQLVEAGYDPDTLRRPNTISTFGDLTTFAIRRRTTAAVTLTPSSLRPAEDPAERLREAVEALPDASRDRADELGQDMAEKAAADVQIVEAAIRQHREKQTA